MQTTTFLPTKSNIETTLKKSTNDLLVSIDSNKLTILILLYMYV